MIDIKITTVHNIINNIISENYFCSLRIKSLVKYNKYLYLPYIIDYLFNQ